MFKKILIAVAALACVVLAVSPSDAGPRTAAEKKQQGLLEPQKKKVLEDGSKKTKTQLLDINKLLQTVIPSLECRDVPLQRVMDEISKKSGVPIVVAEGVTTNVTVTLSFDNIPAGEAIRYTCAGAGVSYKITTSHVIVESAKPKKKQ
jgi:hypothetical protein